MNNGIHWHLVVVMTALFSLFMVRQSVLQPPSPDPTHQFNTERALDRLTYILGDERPHTVDSDANDAVRERLLDLIRNEGFDPRVTDDFHCQPYGQRLICARVQNIRFWVGPPGDDAILLAAHYDSVPAGPGAADDGIGVAAGLEIASILKDRDLERPVMVLLTDGEEIGLNGAWSFVATDPAAQLVTSVVNMEARGIAGPVAMFETSQPNSRDIIGLSANPVVAATNSLLADVYAAMPNGTDMTAFLTLGADGANYAIASRPSFYHTPGDNLTNLDPASVFHLGTNAFAATEGFLGADTQHPEKPMTYANVFGWKVLTVQQNWAFVLIIISGGLALIAFIRETEPDALRAIITPPLAIILGVGLAILTTWLINLLRPEAFFAAADPWALRGAQIMAALFGTGLCVMLIGGQRNPMRQRLSVWIWIALMGGLVSYYFGGALILFAPALAVISVAAFCLFLDWRMAARIALLLGSIIFLIFAVPMTAMGEMMLFPEGSAPFTIFVVLAALTLIPALGGKPNRSRTRDKRVDGPLAVAAVTWASLSVFAISVPAYSEQAPRGLSVTHVTPADDGTPFWSVFGEDPLPAGMRAVADFQQRTPDTPGYGDQWYEAPPTAEAILFAEAKAAADKEIDMQITAPDADRLTLRFARGLNLPSLTINGQRFDQGRFRRIICHGRTCRNLSLSFDVEGEVEVNSAFVTIEHMRYGLGPESDRLVAARPSWAMPQHRGDVRIALQEVGWPPQSP